MAKGASATEDTMQEMSAQLLELHRASNLSYRKVERRVVEILGEEGPSLETIRQYHYGLVSLSRVNLEWLAAICRVYGKTITDVSPTLGQRASNRANLLAGQGVHPFNSFEAA